ncbi:MAG: AAA family ATPase [Succinivibrio sp.]|nr:AAA family ATPase [Succinivibrio sp.]
MKTIAEGQLFSDFNAYDYIYVDKTEYIFSLLRSHRKVFISRPRRFGKSLTLDTIGTLFEYGVEPYFKDTWLYDKWTEGTYPVLRLNFLEFKKDDAEFFKKQFVEQITEFSEKYKVENYKENAEPMDALRSLFSSLRDERRQIVILIDEYDTQLTSNINNSELYEKYQNILREIYGIFKSAPIRFLGITGVTRLKDVALFSNGSDIKDISNHTAYSQMIGFTRDEIRKYYIDYLKIAASCEKGISEDEVTDREIEEILDTLAYHYDGYCFDEMGEKKVFSTWSVNNFFNELSANRKCTYGDYWYDNGGLPTILKNYIESNNPDAVSYLDRKKVVKVRQDDFLNPTSLPEMNQHVLMCQTGYLTLRSGTDTSPVLLGIPNDEVYKAMLRLLAIRYFKGEIDFTNDEGENFLDMGKAEDIIKIFNTAFNSIAYDNYPVVSEASVVSHVMMLLSMPGAFAHTEVHSARGRADLIIERPQRRIVFEFKYAQDENEAKAKLDEAITQIQDKDYGNILPLKKEILRIAAVFNADPKVRAFSEFTAL